MKNKEIPICREVLEKEFKKGDRVDAIVYSGKDCVLAKAYRNGCLNLIQKKTLSEDPSGIGVQVIFDKAELYTRENDTLYIL